MIFSYPSDCIVNIKECLLLDCDDMSHKFLDLLNFCLTTNTNKKVFNIEYSYDNDIVKIKIKEQLDSIRGKLDIKLKHNETIISIKSCSYPKLYYSNKSFLNFLLEVKIYLTIIYLLKEKLSITNMNMKIFLV